MVPPPRGAEMLKGALGPCNFVRFALASRPDLPLASVSPDRSRKSRVLFSCWLHAAASYCLLRVTGAAITEWQMTQG